MLLLRHPFKAYKTRHLASFPDWYVRSIAASVPLSETVPRAIPMFALLILAVSVTALVQFAVCQWRSMWISVAAQPLSDCLKGAVGLAPNHIQSHPFELLARTSE